jgi:hypothetical protein
MPYLTYINDVDLENFVVDLLKNGLKSKRSAEKNFTKNVIDPFATIFDAAISNINHDEWKKSEIVRQCQKTLTTRLGTLHQKILGKVDGWVDLGVGDEVDLKNDSRRIIAEVKNKYNTVTGGSLIDQYNSLSDKVSKKASSWFEYTAYFVNIIPKTSKRFNVPFQPSDRSTGSPVAKNVQVRKIDGASFYHLVTGRENALRELYCVLPTIIEKLMREKCMQEGFEIRDKEKFAQYFNLAFGE